MRCISHDFAIAVGPGDLDRRGYVDQASYLGWVQTGVTDHWRTLAPADAVAAYVWVAVRHAITYRRPAYPGNMLTATVVLQRVRRESAFYDTVIRRGGVVLAEVASRWCCLDARTLRPARLGGDVVGRFFGEPDAGPTAHRGLPSAPRGLPPVGAHCTGLA